MKKAFSERNCFEKLSPGTPLGGLRDSSKFGNDLRISTQYLSRNCIISDCIEREVDFYNNYVIRQIDMNIIFL